jgi:hypothetical protein
MSYKFKLSEKDVIGSKKYKNREGKTECVVFIQQTTGAPGTKLWKMGMKVAEAKPGQIPRGVAIATFDENGNYPTDEKGKHAAVYLLHDGHGIRVLDQFQRQGEVRSRIIRFNNIAATSRSNRAECFCVIE